MPVAGAGLPLRQVMAAAPPRAGNESNSLTNNLLKTRPLLCALRIKALGMCGEWHERGALELGHVKSVARRRLGVQSEGN